MDTYYMAINDFIKKATADGVTLADLAPDRDHIIAMFYHGNSARQAALRLLAEYGVMPTVAC